jgi:hypothetical protein
MIEDGAAHPGAGRVFGRIVAAAESATGLM